MDDHYINNLHNPVHDQDAVTKTYAHTKLSRNGGTMIGDIQMTDIRITGLSDPIGNQDATTKWYVDNNRSSSLGATIFKQPLLEVRVTLAKIPLIIFLFMHFCLVRIAFIIGGGDICFYACMYYIVTSIVTS